MKIKDIDFSVSGWVAYQPYGCWCWYRNKPILTENSWIVDTDGVEINLGFMKIEGVDNWKTSLIELK